MGTTPNGPSQRTLRGSSPPRSHAREPRPAPSTRSAAAQLEAVSARRRRQLLWIALKRIWPKWDEALQLLQLLQPATLIKWHRAGFRDCGRSKSYNRGGRPGTDPQLRKLIRDMSNANPTWGKRRIDAMRADAAPCDLNATEGVSTKIDSSGTAPAFPDMSIWNTAASCFRDGLCGSV